MFVIVGIKPDGAARCLGTAKGNSEEERVAVAKRSVLIVKAMLQCEHAKLYVLRLDDDTAKYAIGDMGQEDIAPTREQMVEKLAGGVEELRP